MDADGQTVISGHLDNNIRLWDARTGVGIKELTGVHSGQITSVSMSPGKNKLTGAIDYCILKILLIDGTCILTNSRDNTLKIIDVRMYDIVKSFQ
jgi:autophagy-related protein 16